MRFRERRRRKYGPGENQTYASTGFVHSPRCWSQGWQYDGALAGTEGEAKRLESLEVQLVPKSETMGLVYRVHRQTYGWETSYKTMGQVSGTTGEGKRLEGIEIALTGNEYSGSIEYSTHVQSYGWMNEVSNGMMSGTSGQAKRLEAIRIRLKGEIANHYNICYRVHAQTYGWLSWAWNGDSAGTSGLGKRLEAIQIVLVKKDDGVLTDLNGIKSKAAFPYITPHDCKWKTVVDEPAHETPIYEEQDVYEWHCIWPDGSYADDLADAAAKQKWCMLHCISCNPNCPDPDPAGRCSIDVADTQVFVGTKKVQIGTKRTEAITHQECEYCGLRKQ